jgi:hypothetical protein
MTPAELRQAAVFAARFEYYTQRFTTFVNGKTELFTLSVNEIEGAARDGLVTVGLEKHASPVPNPARVREYWADVLPPGTPAQDYPQDWCGCFVLWCLHRAGLGLELHWQIGRGFASHLRQLAPHERPQPGDLAYFAHNQHHALVESAREGLCVSNTAVSDQFDSVDGNQPAIERRRGRSLSVPAAFYSIEPLIQKVSPTPP